MSPEIEQLITLQHADSEIRRLNAEIAEFPNGLPSLNKSLPARKLRLKKPKTR